MKEKLEKNVFSHPIWMTAWEDDYRNICEKLVEDFFEDYSQRLIKEIKDKLLKVKRERPYQDYDVGYNQCLKRIQSIITNLEK